MPVYHESGFRLDLPDDLSFRFQDMGAYRRLSGRRLKEMDFGWWDDQGRSLILLEIKDFTRGGEKRSPAWLDGVLVELADKAVDSLLMLAAAWIGTAVGREILGLIPNDCRTFPTGPPEGNARLRLVFVIKPPRSVRKEGLAHLNDKLRTLLSGKLALFDGPLLQVVDDGTARDLLGLPIRRV